MKITDLIKDEKYDYYIHKSPDYGDLDVNSKVNSYFTNGIINIKNKDLNRTALKIEFDRDKTKMAFKYYIDPEASLTEQYTQIFETKLGGGLSYRDYAVIIKAPKVERDSIIVPNGLTYKIDKENIICVLHRTENIHDDSYDYQMYVSPLFKQQNFFRLPRKDELGDSCIFKENQQEFGSSKGIVSAEKLREMINNGFNIISIKKNDDIFEVEFEKQELNKPEEKRRTI